MNVFKKKMIPLSYELSLEQNFSGSYVFPFLY